MTTIRSFLNHERNKLRTINKILILILTILVLTLVIITSIKKTEAIIGTIAIIAGFFIWLFPFDISEIRFISKLYCLLLIIILLAGLILFVCSTSLKYRVTETYKTIKSELSVVSTSETIDIPIIPPAIEPEISPEIHNIDNETEETEELCLFINGCLLSETWAIYPRDNYLPDENGCLIFPVSWGVEITCNEIDIFPIENINTESNGNTFYLTLDGNYKISFELSIHKLEGVNDIAYLAFGISSTNPETPLHINPQKGLYFQRESVDDFINRIYYKDAWVGDEGNYLRDEDNNYRIYEIGTTLKLIFSVDGNELKIYESGRILMEPIQVPAQNRAFWISYYFQTSGSLKTTISNFSLSPTPISLNKTATPQTISPSATSPQVCSISIEDLSFNQITATVGTTVNVHGKVTWNSCFRTMRLKIDGTIVYEFGVPEFNYSWNTSGYSAGNHTIRLEVAVQGDNNWSNPSVREATYTLSSNGLSTPTLVSPSNGALLPPGTD